MFKIGEFARISQVPVKTLRYYDDIGLLKPASVDAVSSYRYYTLEQLPRLNRILALKDLGFSLEQIATLLDEPFMTSELRGMLRLKRAELQQTLRTEQARLDRIEARLKLIEDEASPPHHDIVLKSVESQTIISGREIIASSDEVDERCRQLGIRLYQTLAALSIKLHGPLFTIYHDARTYTGQDSDIDLEMGIVLDPATLPLSLPQHCDLSVRMLPATENVASMIYTGPYAGLWQVYGYVLNWIDTHQYRRSGPYRFIYLRDSQHVSTGGDPITELQFPLSKKEILQE